MSKRVPAFVRMTGNILRLRVELDEQQELDFQVVFEDRKKGDTSKSLTPERLMWGWIDDDLTRKEGSNPSIMELYKFLRREKSAVVGRRMDADLRIDWPLPDVPVDDSPVDTTPGSGVYFVRIGEEMLLDLQKAAAVVAARQKALDVPRRWKTVNEYAALAINEGIERDHNGIRKRKRDEERQAQDEEDKKVREEAEKLSKKSEEKKP